MENYLYQAKGELQIKSILKSLDKNGFVMIRGLFSDKYLDKIVVKTENLLKNPSVAGKIGYTKIDHPKKIVDPSLLGESVMKLLVNETIIDIVESLFQSQCVLAEAFIKHDKGVGYPYLPLHSDFSEGWSKGENHDFSLEKEHLNTPLGVGGIVYFHDTIDGAFCYSRGSHKLKSCYGQQLNNYPLKIKQEILENLVKIEGKKGDVVLFNDIGFHGPDQPSQSDRLCLLLDYYNVNVFGHTQVYPMNTLLSSLKNLTDKQKYVIGLGADYMVPIKDNSQQRIHNSIFYNLIVFIIENAFLTNHIKCTIRQWLRSTKKINE